MSTSLQSLSDEAVAALYENIRQQVESDRSHKHRFTSGPGTRQRADELRQELMRRNLYCPPIDWSGRMISEPPTSDRADRLL